MINKGNNLWYLSKFFIIIGIIIGIIGIFMIIDKIDEEQETYKENFTTHIKKTYRPIIRKYRTKIFDIYNILHKYIITKINRYI